MTSSDNRTRERVSLVIAAAITVAVVGALFWRIRRGIDFTDESFYVALPVRFALGDRPFVDELNIAQCAGVLLYPFVKLHVMLRGTTGIFMFMRFLYAAFFGCVGWAAYALASTRLPKHTALLTSAPCILFVPYAIPGLSYNTVGCGLLAIGLFVVTRALVSPPDEVPKFFADRLTWGGFALAAASFAYPTLVVGAFGATCAAFALAGGRRVRTAGRVVLGGALFTLLISPVLLRAGLAHIRETLAYSGGGEVTFSLAALGQVVDLFFAHHPAWAKTAAIVAIAVVLARKWPRLVVFGLPLLPFVPRDAMTGLLLSNDFIASFALSGPLFALALRDGRTARTMFVGVWVPSACCGLAAVWTSSNHAYAAALGLFAGAILSGIFLAMWITELVRPFQTPALRAAFGFAPVVLLYILIKFLVHDEAVYRDGRLEELTAVVTEGPYKGLLTTPSRKRSLAAMSADIVSLANGPRALFYYDFPAGYIISATRPLVASPWIFPHEPRISRDTQKFVERATPGDVVFRIGRMTKTDPLDIAVAARCDAVGPRDGYTVWRVR